MNLNHPKSSSLLAAEGPIAGLIPGFAERQSQLEMAEAVEQAMQENTVLVAEAGTGTGKTFAYLVPALMSGQKVIISTGTKNLQDQLFHKDFPIIRKALASSVKVALLKGRASYLCLQRIQRYLTDGRFINRETIQQLHVVERWSRSTQTGDLAELAEVPEDSQVWPYVTSTADNCLGQNCPLWQDCFLVKARRKAQEADIVVVNHHLFFADLAIKDQGFGELLPLAHILIFDEAHQLPEIATQFFGESISSRQLIELVRDAEAAMVQEAKDATALKLTTDSLQKAVADMRLAFGEANRRKPWQVIKHKPQLQQAIASVKEILYTLTELLESLAIRGKELAHCWRRSHELKNVFEKLTALEAPGHIHWYEVYTKAFVVYLTPLTIDKQFQVLFTAKEQAWIFTSATLSVDRDFSHFINQLGLMNARTLQLESPFNYNRQALLYLPPAMPEPQQPAYIYALIKAALPVLQASQGRAFLLFTSHTALRTAAELLQGHLPYPVLIQGQLPKIQLLEQFCRLGNAVLLGTSSFWEGVDVRGNALSCVIIDKLPFAAPDDPILQAKASSLQQQGLDAFTAYQLPKAVIALKQGIGRLIRDVEDRGVLMIADPRILTRSYGQIFLSSLPPVPITQNIAEVKTFFEKEASDVA